METCVFFWALAPINGLWWMRNSRNIAKATSVQLQSTLCQQDQARSIQLHHLCRKIGFQPLIRGTVLRIDPEASSEPTSGTGAWPHKVDSLIDRLYHRKLRYRFYRKMLQHPKSHRRFHPFFADSRNKSIAFIIRWFYTPRYIFTYQWQIPFLFYNYLTHFKDEMCVSDFASSPKRKWVCTTFVHLTVPCFEVKSAPFVVGWLK